MWRCVARTLCLRPMKTMCPTTRKTAELETYLTGFLLLLIGLLVLYLLFGGHKPDMDMPFLEMGGADKDNAQARAAQLAREHQMMADLEHGQVVRAHMDIPHRDLNGRHQVARRRNPADDIFDPLKAGKLPRILGGGVGGVGGGGGVGGNNKELDYGNDDTDLHGFVGPERVYFYNHEEQPLRKDEVRKARKEMKLLRKIEDDDKNEDNIKPDAVDEPGFHGFVGPETVIEYENDEASLVKRKRKQKQKQVQQRAQRAKAEFLGVKKKWGGEMDNTPKVKTRLRRSVSPPQRTLQRVITSANDNDALSSACEWCVVYNLSSAFDLGDEGQQRGAHFECISLSIKPNTPVCLHNDSDDIHISRTLRRDGIWEPHIIKEIQNILYQDPEMNLIDIGANIGVYSLIAANMGHKVLAVEPYMENIRRLHKAAQMAGVAERITLLRNAVSDTRGRVRLELSKANQGGIRIDQRSVTKRRRCAETRPSSSNGCGPYVNAVTLNDLSHHLPFDKAVLKMDIEGHEHLALSHATALLDSVYIPFIVMEWQKVREYFGSKVTDTRDKDLVWDMVRLLTARGYSASSLVTGIQLDIALWYGWPDDVIWKHELKDLL